MIPLYCTYYDKYNVYPTAELIPWITYLCSKTGLIVNPQEYFKGIAKYDDRLLYWSYYMPGTF